MAAVTFSAAIRRPKAIEGGLVAEFFATNGEAADATLQLGRSAIQDAKVRVSMSVDGEDIGAFEAYVRRPSPLISGMVARFYGEDGPDADLIASLMLTRFQDLAVVVHVELLQMPDGGEAPKKAEKPPKGPHASSAADLWRSGFLARPEVWTALRLQYHAASDVEQMRKASWEALRKVFAVSTMADVAPERIKAWAGERDLSRFLPARY